MYICISVIFLYLSVCIYQDVCDAFCLVVNAVPGSLFVCRDTLALLQSLLLHSLCGCLCAYIGFTLVDSFGAAYVCIYVLCCLYVQTFCWCLGYS